MVEVEHLRADVARLLTMLKNTQEYKEFSVKKNRLFLFENTIEFSNYFLFL